MLYILLSVDSIHSGCVLLLLLAYRILRLFVHVAVSNVGIFLLILECEKQIDV
jgi:hypothetical protein